jgi:hypothetical protein
MKKRAKSDEGCKTPINWGEVHQHLTKSMA